MIGRKHRPGVEFRNLHVEADGHRYRVALNHRGYPLSVSRRCSAGGEFHLDPWGRRAKAIVAKAREAATQIGDNLPASGPHSRETEIRLPEPTEDAENA